MRLADDTADFFKIIHDPVWRSRRDQRILKFLNFRGKFISKDFVKLDSGLVKPTEKTVVRKAKEKFQTLSMNFTRFNSSYFENTYLPPMTEGYVQILLGQFPVSNRSKNWRSHIESNDAISPHRDSSLPPNYACTSLSSFEKFLMEELWTQIPRVFLENYAVVRQISLQIMPRRAAYAFTSNSFHQDEVFKFWIAESKMAGTKYIVGQHGNNYGANLLVSENPEEMTCDTFLTWGWSSIDPKYLPSTCFNIAGRPQTTSSLGRVILVSKSMPGEDEAWDETKEYYDQLVQQHDFVDQLELEIQSNTTIRITPLNSRVGDSLPNSWSNDIGRCNLDFGEVSYRKIRTDYRLAVFSYDSSGLLEGLASNIPTMGFWLDGLDHLNDSAKHKYQHLIDAEIIFFDSKKCASKVNDIWEDVAGWWSSSKVQSARIEFCKDFCESSQNPASVIAAAIRKALDSSVPKTKVCKD
jgi:putative transferase (TIGR04331 family)